MKLKIIIPVIMFVFLMFVPKVIKAQGPSFDCNSGFQNLVQGITYKKLTTSSPRKLTFFVVKVNLDDANLDYMVTPRTDLGTTTSAFAANFGATVAINGDLFWALNDPAGLAAAQGDIYSDASAEPSFFISQDNKVTFFLKGPGGALWDAISGSTTLIQSGVINDKLFTCAKPEYCSLFRPRTSVGKTGDNHLIIIVVDGDQPGYSIGVSLLELAGMQLNCKSRQAINMDGGSSSTLVFNQGVFNRPPGGERVVSNHFAVCLGSCNQVLDPSKNCFVTDIRNNPGDSLFAGVMTADLKYTVNFSCVFLIPGGGRLCEYIGGTCQNVPSNYNCLWNYGGVDCYNDAYGDVAGNTCAIDCSPLPTGWPCESIPVSSYPSRCVPDTWTCEIPIADGYPTCPYNYKCGANCHDTIDYPFPIEQICTVNPYVTINTIIKTPLAEKIWKRLVAGPSGVFKRFIPKIATDSSTPIAYINEIFGMSPAEYKSLDGSTIIAGNPSSGRPGSQAEIYFPYIGGIHQYFLQCIQTFLRPKGYGEYCPKGSPSAAPPIIPPPGGGGGTCQESNSQYCNVTYLSQTFGDKASIASQICFLESGGYPDRINSNCLTGKSYDYSVGLFQINLVPIPYYDAAGNLIELREGRCPGAFVTDVTRVHPPFCIIKNASVLQACVTQYQNPDYNILRAWQISSYGTNWCPWKTAATICNIQSCP